MIIMCVSFVHRAIYVLYIYCSSVRTECTLEVNNNNDMCAFNVFVVYCSIESVMLSD